MKSVKIGWFGDSQLDYSQYGMPRRRDDFTASVFAALQDMATEGINHVIHAGDFLQSNRPSPGTMKALQGMQQILEQREMIVYVISGNHDNARPHWIDVLNAGSPRGFQLIDYKLVNAGGVSVYGLPNMGRDAFLKQEFKPSDILVMHQVVVEFINFPSPNALAALELPFNKYQVIAIGDIHINNIQPIQQLLPGEKVNFDCLIGYAGATELNSETEPDEKFWIELCFDIGEAGEPSKLTYWKAHRIPTRPIIRLSIKTAEDLDAAVDSTKQKVEELKRQDPREPIIFVHYSSRIPNVIDRFRKNFDPDTYILRFHAEFSSAATGVEAVGAETRAKLSITDLLKAEIPETDALYGLASQLFNPELEQEHIAGAIDAYVEERLKIAR